MVLDGFLPCVHFHFLCLCLGSMESERFFGLLELVFESDDLGVFLVDFMEELGLFDEADRVSGLGLVDCE